MSLTKHDLNDIREIVLDALDVAVNPRFDALEARMDSLEKGQREQKIVLDEHTRLLNEHARHLRRIDDRLDNIEGRLQALETDVKELYRLVGQQSGVNTDQKFAKLSPADKLRRLHAEVI